MLLIIGNVLEAAATATLASALERMPFADGRATAGWAARPVKHNMQAEPDPLADQWCETISAALARHELFRLAAQPKRIIGPMISRYRPGDHYGAHVDDAMLDGSRADVAFTIFLNPPRTYDGGELVIDTPAGDDAHKLDAGTMVLYPANTLHRVAAVTRGIRYAAVGWVRSLIRNPEQRELLFDLERSRRALFEQHGKTAEFDLLSKCAANLMRMWCED